MEIFCFGVLIKVQISVFLSFPETKVLVSSHHFSDPVSSFTVIKWRSHKTLSVTINWLRDSPRQSSLNNSYFIPTYTNTWHSSAISGTLLITADQSIHKSGFYHISWSYYASSRIWNLFSFWPIHTGTVLAFNYFKLYFHK